MSTIGNKRANEYWEAQLSIHPRLKKIQATCPQEERQAFIEAKYREKEFVNPAAGH